MLFILNKFQNSVGIMSNELPDALPYFDDLHNEALENNLETFEFSVPSNHPSSSLLEVEGYVIYTDLDNKKHLFIIKEMVEKNDGTYIKKVYCENSIVGDLIGNITRPAAMNNISLENAAKTILNGTGWSVGNVDYLEIKNVIFEDHITTLEALHKLAEIYGAEMEFEVIFTGTKISEKLVHMVEKRGNKTGKIFEYSKDLQEIEKQEDSKELITALIGVGKKYDNGSYLTFTSFTPALDEEYKKENDYIYSESAFQMFNNNGRHIFGIYKDEEATTESELYNNTLNRLKELSKPKLTYTAKVVMLEKLTGYEHEKVRIGDEIIIKDFSFTDPLVLEARVIELKRSKNNPSNDEVVLGDYRKVELAPFEYIQKLQNKIFAKEVEWNEASQIATEAKTTAQTANTNASDALTQVEGKVNKTEVIQTINTSVEEVKMDPLKVNLENYIEATHIKSLLGLNINDKFVVDGEGNVTFSGVLSGASGNFTGNIHSIGSETDFDETVFILEATLSNGLLSLTKDPKSLYDLNDTSKQENFIFNLSDYTGVIQFNNLEYGCGGEITMNALGDMTLRGYTNGYMSDGNVIATNLTANGSPLNAMEGVFVKGGYIQFKAFNSSYGPGDDTAQIYFNENANKMQFHKRDSQGNVKAIDLGVTGEILNEAMISPSMVNGWVNFGSNYRNAGFFKDKNGVVHLTGTIKGGSSSTHIFYLPAGYRPAGQLIFNVLTNNGVQRLDIFGNANGSASGTVKYSGVTTTYICLDGISFRGEY